MGSPLGPTFANFYMCNLENHVLNEINYKPKIYCRYVDDIFLVIKNVDDLNKLKSDFEKNSILKFTYEIEKDKTLPFLDVQLCNNTKSTNHNSNNNNSFNNNNNVKISTSVYSKTTSSNTCINYNSICPNRYKVGVIKTFLHRAYLICDNWKSLDNEIKRIK